MTREEWLSTLSDFDRYCDDRRRELEQNRVTQDKIDEFVSHCETIRLRLMENFQGNVENRRSCAVELVQQPENLLAVVTFLGALKKYSGTSVRKRVDTEGPDIVAMLSQPPEIPLDPAHSYESMAEFEFGEMDGERHCISTIPCSNPDLIRRFQKSGNQILYSVSGVLLALDGTYKLLLVDLHELTDPLSLLTPTSRELEEARMVISKHGGRSLLSTLVNIVRHDLGIIDSGDVTFNTLLEVMMYQASSHGSHRGESLRIHTYVIGTPGTSKGEAGKAGEAAQPICRTVEPQSITEDGLYGNSGSAGGKRVIRVGLIAQAHLGLFKIADFHQANSLKNSRLTTSFTATMETGRVAAANASRMMYKAEVAFHIDSNRRSDVDGKGPKSKCLDGLQRVVADTGLPKNVLTRCDYIEEIFRDPIRQVALSLSIARAPVEPRLPGATAPGRLAAVIIAELRTRIPFVSISEEVAEYLADRFLKVFNVDVNFLNQFPDYADFMTRGPKSYKKFVMAHARLCNRAFAIHDDVDKVFPYVLRKFETVIGWLVGDKNSGGTQAARKAARQLLIRIKFGGQAVTLQQVSANFQGISDKTLKRDLEDVCGGKGSDEAWSVPLFGRDVRSNVAPSNSDDGPVSDVTKALPSPGAEV